MLIIKFFARLAVVAVALLSPLSEALAQNSTASPYSMYGIGLVNHKEDACAAGLGHAGVALAPNEWVNVSNPAALGKLDSLTFYFNFQLKGFRCHQSVPNDGKSIYSGNLDGISMGFRGRKWFAMAFGYAPYSMVGYNFYDTKYISGSDLRYKVYHRGSGGLQQAFVNGSFTFFDHLTLGANFSALWGSVSRKEVSKFSEVIAGEDITNSRKYTVNNIYWEVGLQFDFNLGQNNFRFGGVYYPEKNLYPSYDQVVSNDVAGEMFHDDHVSFSNGFHVPQAFAAGFSYTRRRFVATIDYRQDMWGDIKNGRLDQTTRFRDEHYVGGGIQYSAGQRSDPFYKRMRYRLGGFYTKEYIAIRTVNLQHRGVTAGISIPTGRSSNYLNLSVEWTKRGTVFNGMVEERYTTFKLAFNVHETWFLKSKFD